MSQFFKRLRCLLGWHSPARRRVRYDGHLKIGPCKYCGVQLEKHSDGRWVIRPQQGAGTRDTVVQED